jgi:hypothetical protein
MWCANGNWNHFLEMVLDESRGIRIIFDDNKWSGIMERSFLASKHE